MKEERVMDKIKVTEEKRLKAASGMAMLFVSLIVMLLGIPAYVLGGAYVSMDGPASGAVLAVAIIIGVILNCTGFIMLFGLRILQPNEALVLTLFGIITERVKARAFTGLIPSVPPSILPQKIRSQQKRAQPPRAAPLTSI